MSADCEVSSIIPTDKIESSPQEVDERLKCPSQTGCHQLKKKEKRLRFFEAFEQGNLKIKANWSELLTKGFI